jgi:ABC-type proline/glycine betaine transport system permease subunit
MPNRLTRVPESPPPSLKKFAWVVGLADLAMKCFFSTPASGTLETTWVTPASLWTSYLAALALIVLAVLCATELSVDLGIWAVVLIALACSVLAVACAAIAAAGTLQRILPR